jgi:hypothetical protein
LLRVEDGGDLRGIATPPFPPALAPIPAGVASIYGAAAPFGTTAFAVRDAADITSPSAEPVREPIPGLRVVGSLWEGERFSLRVPRAWNGRLVVAGTPGQRTESACDLLFGDALLSRGYAYACGNKGNGDGAALLEDDARLIVDGIALPRFPLPGSRALAFWQHAPGRLIERWLDETLELTAVSRDVLRERCGREPEATYAIGLSNGGYQIRRAIEESDLFDGALLWNAVLWSREYNLLDSLADAIAGNVTDFPPDVAARSGAGSLYAKNAAIYWYVTLWLHATHLDPETSIAYGDVADSAAAESWCARIAQWRPGPSPAIGRRIDAIANTGRIRCKTIDLCSEYDQLVPPAIHFEPYGRMVEAAGQSASYRGRTIAGAPHVDSWALDPEYPVLRPGRDEVLAAWDELVAWVE